MSYEFVPHTRLSTRVRDKYATSRHHYVHNSQLAIWPTIPSLNLPLCRNLRVRFARAACHFGYFRPSQPIRPRCRINNDLASSR
jgi:hypothetical protein